MCHAISLLNLMRIQITDTMRSHYNPIGMVGGGAGLFSVWFDWIAATSGKIAAIVGCVLAVWALWEKVRSYRQRQRDDIEP
jgi:hypothetical protein